VTGPAYATPTPHADVASAAREAASSASAYALDGRQAALFILGLAQAAIVLPPLHLGAFLLNAAIAYWIAHRPWNWLRKYTSFFLVETFYIFLKFHFPRPGAEQNALFRHVLPHGPYFAFLWSAIEVVAFLKLLDFVLCRQGVRDRRQFGPGRFLFFLFYPFAFLAGPVIGFEDFFKSYARPATRFADLVYCARKLAWGAVQLLVVSVWLAARLPGLRAAIVAGRPPVSGLDPRIQMWAWLAGMSVLLYVAYKGYVDIMLGASRLAGFRFYEQFWFTLFARDPVEYWQNGNQSVYRITSQHVFNRFFGKTWIAPKSVMSTVASGIFHSLMCPGITLGGGLLLGGLFGVSGVAVAVVQRLRRTRVVELFAWAEEGTGRNALVIAGVILTFSLMAFPRTSFLLLVEGVSVAEWWRLMRHLFVRP
jgi:D-alanyl-lipoteichoic acid acyltransferase DltB (MBOAT superfamily)